MLLVVGMCSHCQKLVYFFLLRPTALSPQERQRRYLSLSPWDKATLSLVSLKHTLLCFTLSVFSTNLPVLASLQGRMILSNKIARTVAFFYTLFLHCLVFLVGLPSTPEDFLVLCRQQQMKRISNVRCGFYSRCCTRLRGARVSAETAPLSVLKSEFVHPTAE